MDTKNCLHWDAKFCTLSLMESDYDAWKTTEPEPYEDDLEERGRNEAFEDEQAEREEAESPPWDTCTYFYADPDPPGFCGRPRPCPMHDSEAR